MCIGIPMRVVESNGASALCEGRNGRERLNMLLVSDAQAGNWVLAFLGYARELLTEDDAARINAALDQVEAAVRGEFGPASHFPDSVKRN